MRKITECLAVFAIGALGYPLLEIMWRGFSHWTMAVTGGLCLLFIYRLEAEYSAVPAWKKCAAGSLFITLCELTVGFVVNILLGWAVWDYSGLRLDLFGQVSLLYSCIWFVLCIPALYLCRKLRGGIGRILARVPEHSALLSQETLHR